MMYYLAYDDTGEILGVFERGDEMDQPMITISAEQRTAVLERPHEYRVVNEILEKVEQPILTSPAVRLDSRVLIAGVVVDDVCYATNAEALSVLSLGVSVGEPYAIVHRPSGDELVKVSKLVADKIHKALLKKAVRSINGSLI